MQRTRCHLEGVYNAVPAHVVPVTRGSAAVVEVPELHPPVPASREKNVLFLGGGGGVGGGDASSVERGKVHEI